MGPVEGRVATESHWACWKAAAGGLRDTLGMSVGDVGSCSPFPVPPRCLKEAISCPGHPGSKVDTPTPVQETSCQGDPGDSVGVSG